MKSQGPLIIEAYTSANYNGRPAGFGTEKSLINVFQVAVMTPVTVGQGDNAEQMCMMDGMFVKYPFDVLRNQLAAKGVILPAPKV